MQTITLPYRWIKQRRAGVYAFVSALAAVNVDELHSGTKLEADLGLCCEDLDGLLLAFADKYTVSFEDFNYYTHFSKEDQEGPHTLIHLLIKLFALPFVIFCMYAWPKLLEKISFFNIFAEAPVIGTPKDLTLRELVLMTYTRDYTTAMHTRLIAA
jgi:hypothetical protein